MSKPNKTDVPDKALEHKSNALHSLAKRLRVSPKVLESTLKKTAFRECTTDEEFVACVMVANKYGLDPILRQIYAFPATKGGVVPVVPIDGWVKMVTEHERYNGVILTENKADKKDNVPGNVESITATFHCKGIDNPVVITERMVECYKGNRDTWKTMPVRMLRHKAYIQGARLAFGFSGIFDADEAQTIIDIDMTTNGEDEPRQIPQRLQTPPEESTPSKPSKPSQIKTIPEAELAEVKERKEKLRKDLQEHNKGLHLDVDKEPTQEDFTTDKSFKNGRVAPKDEDFDVIDELRDNYEEPEKEKTPSPYLDSPSETQVMIDQYKKIEDKIKKSTAKKKLLSTVDQQKRIHILASKLHLAETALHHILAQDYDVDSTANLSREQADEVIKAMSDQLNERIGKTTEEG